MAGIMVPKAKAETPVGGGKTVFPEGSFVGTIEETRERPFPDWIDPVSRPKGGYASSDGETISIQIGSNRNLDETGPNAGNQKMFVDFVVRDGAQTVDAGPNIDERSWQMQQSAALLTNLAMVLGATEEVEGEDGLTYVTTTDDFLDTLRSGGYNNTSLGFTTYHRNWKSGEKSGTEVRLLEFFEAV